MKQLVKPLTKTPKSEKVSNERHEMLLELFRSKKAQCTLDGKKRVVISRLGHKFPIVSIAASGFEVEYSSKAIEHILRTDCKFSSK